MVNDSAKKDLPHSFEACTCLKTRELLSEKKISRTRVENDNCYS